jgi:hypothetical protein
VWTDPARDFGLSETFVIGAAAWLHGVDKVAAKLFEVVDKLPKQGAVSTAKQEARLAELHDMILSLERDEESLIMAAHASGVDVLRRAGASPQAVLCCTVTAKKAAVPVVEEPAALPAAAE